MNARDYRDDAGEPLPGCSEILDSIDFGGAFERGAGFGGSVGDAWPIVRDEAASVGTIVHAAIAAALLGQEHAPDPPPRQKKRVMRSMTSWAYWLAALPREWAPIDVERPIVNPRLGFGGTPDAVVRMGDRTVLIDWKTGREITPRDRVKSCAYARYLLWDIDAIRVDEVQTVRLDKAAAGPPEIDVIQRDSDAFHAACALFMAAVTAHRRLEAFAGASPSSSGATDV